MSYFGMSIFPSLSPSRAQLRRYAILGFARHTHPEVLVEYWCCSHLRSTIKPQNTNHPLFMLTATYQVPPSYRYAAPKVCLQRSLASKARSAELQTTSLLNECCVSDVASVAMDGVAPDLVQEAPWREERH